MHTAEGSKRHRFLARRAPAQRTGYGGRYPHAAASLLQEGWHAHVVQASELERADSLTAALRTFGQLKVKLVQSSLGRPTRSERAVLRGVSWVWVRRIELLVNDVPVVKARSVIARAHMRSGPIQLHRLGTRPLGDVLFDDARVVRSHLAFKRERGQLTRRGLFVAPRQVLLVQEWFLPTIMALK